MGLSEEFLKQFKETCFWVFGFPALMLLIFAICGITMIPFAVTCYFTQKLVIIVPVAVANLVLSSIILGTWANYKKDQNDLSTSNRSKRRNNMWDISGL